MILGDDVLNIFEQLFEAKRHWAAIASLVRLRDAELTQLRRDLDIAEEQVGSLLAKVDDKAGAVAGVHEEVEVPSERPVGYLPIQRY